MTNKTLSRKFRTLIVFLSVLCVFCMCAFAVACGSSSDNPETPEKTYSYTETDTEIISNANFLFGTHDKTADDFPITSSTGWTRSADNSALTSNVSSGVISVNSWDKVFDKLYEDSDFLKYCEYKYKDDIGDKTGDEKKAVIKAKYANPDTHDGAPDKFVYMLNNYSATYGKGTAQRLRSSSTVSVKKGEFYEISVWVKTLNLVNNGANIRIENSVKGNKQAEFRIDNINNTDWVKYTVYFVANEDYDCSFTLMLGLGYGNGKNIYTEDYAEGTVFFDDISVKKIENTDLPAAFTDEKILVLGSKDALSVTPAGENKFKYDLNFATDTYFTNAVALTSITGALTTSNDAGVVQTGTGSYDNATGVVTLNKASYTLTLKNGTNNFNITTAGEDDYEKYMLVSFKLKNELDKLGSTDITINVVDKYGTAEETREAVATFSEISEDGEFTTCNILVKNNFKDQAREFYIEIVVGPADIKSVTAAADFASGTVTVKDIKATEAKYISAEKYPDKENDAQYKFYTFFNADTDATVALYAGYNSDYEEHNHGDDFSLTPAKGNIGQITSHPTAVNGYSGIVSNHVYVKGEDNGNSNELETKINDRLAFDGEKGYAGLINTKYINEDTEHTPKWWNGYSEAANLTALLNGLYDADNNIQPIVIYNKTADHYGFIGAQKTVAASAYAKVTVKLKVFDDAKAYIYLVDTSKAAKTVMQFADFTVNTTDGLKNAGINGTTYSAADHKFMLTVDKNATVGDDKWVEVNFYIATGTDAKSFRVEIWNGGRDGGEDTKSLGYVVVNSITVTTTSAFTEPTSWQTAFDSTGNPLYDATIGGFAGGELIAYTRELTDTEKKFNKEYPDKAVSYKSSYVWASNDTTVYAVFNTVNPVVKNPYDDITPEEKGGCKANSDPSTFWLSFSSIVLAAVLVLAIVALFVKRFRLRRKANKSDAKSQYKVKSRTESQKEIKKAKEKQAAKSVASPEPEEIKAEETDTIETAEEIKPENAETAEPAENNAESGEDTEQTGYVYGEVQDFGDMTLDIPEEKPAENSEDKKDE